MKPITLKEFAELAKNDEALKEKIVNSVMPGGEPQELIDLAAEYGYELTEEGLYSDVWDSEELSDDELRKVAGGQSFVSRADLCVWIMSGIFGFDPEPCYD